MEHRLCGDKRLCRSYVVFGVDVHDGEQFASCISCLHRVFVLSVTNRVRQNVVPNVFQTILQFFFFVKIEEGVGNVKVDMRHSGKRRCVYRVIRHSEQRFLSAYYKSGVVLSDTFGYGGARDLVEGFMHDRR
eukprot:7387812-Prymnesium_polylepis.1